MPRGPEALGTAPGAGEEEQGSGGSRGPSWLCCSTARSCGAAARAGKEEGSAQKRRFSAVPCPYMGSGAVWARSGHPLQGTRTEGPPLHSLATGPPLAPVHAEHGHVPGILLPSIPRNLEPR